MIQVVWEFVVRPEALERFEQAYGADGPWVRLFERHAGYGGTVLWRDRGNPLRYLTIDTWETADQRAAMLAASHEEYARLDRELGRLTESEKELGLFEPGAGRASTDTTTERSAGSCRAARGRARAR